MRNVWRDVIPRWFKPINQPCPATGAHDAARYSAGRKEPDGAGARGELRTIIVYATGFDTYHFEHAHLQPGAISLVGTDPLKRFWGKILGVEEEDFLVLMDESLAPTFIPWQSIRYIEVQ